MVLLFSDDLHLPGNENRANSHLAAIDAKDTRVEQL